MERIKEIAVVPVEGENVPVYDSARPAILMLAAYRLPIEGRSGGFKFTSSILDVWPKEDDDHRFDGTERGSFEIELIRSPRTGKTS